MDIMKKEAMPRALKDYVNLQNQDSNTKRRCPYEI